MLRTSIFHANERALFYDEYRIAYRIKATEYWSIVYD